MKAKKEILQAKINELEQTVQNLQQAVQSEQWLDSYDVKNKFNISDSTLARYRKKQLIPYTKFGKKYLYPLSFFTKSLSKKIVNSHLL